MEDTLITFETAKLAKDKGFQIPTVFHYDDKGTSCKYFNVKNNWNMPANEVLYSAPTQTLLQKWLRTTRKIHITITSISQESWQYHVTKVGEKLGMVFAEDYYTYEEALEDGLKQALLVL